MAVLSVLVGWSTPLFYFLLFLPFTLFLGYCAYIKYMHMKYDHIPGPPRNSFILGHYGAFMEAAGEDDTLIFDTFKGWSEKYGPVYRLNLLHTVVIGVTCPHATKEVLMSAKYPKDKIYHRRVFNLCGERVPAAHLAEDYR